MAYRSWQLDGHDEVKDDDEDRRIARLAARHEASWAGADEAEPGESLDDEAASVHDDIEAAYRVGAAAVAGDSVDLRGGAGGAGPGGAGLGDAAPGPVGGDRP
jgi:multicomponent Na+:H+ antiporter subunit C